MGRDEFDKALSDIGFTSRAFGDKLWETQDRSKSFTTLTVEEFKRRALIWKKRNPDIFEICNNPGNDDPEKQKVLSIMYY